MDGYLKIKTKIDNKDVDKQIKQLEDKIKKMQTDISQGEKEQESLQMQINQYEELANEAEEYRQTLKRLEKDRANMVKSDPNLVVSNTPEYTNLMTQIDSIKQKYATATKELDKQAPKIDKVYSKLEQVKAKQTENNAKIIQYRQEIEQVNMQNMQKGVDNVGKSITKQIKKIGKLGMAVIGIRSAWFAVRGAINAVTQYNDQVAADFEYMRYAVAQLLLPAVQQLVKILFTVLSYVNAITSAWFGINLFSNASAKSFQKMKAGASGTAKAVKEIQKSLQGFDEMNVMSDNSSSGSGTSAGGVAPSMDLTGMQGEVPAWLQWIIDNKDLIIATLGGIAAGILAIKLGLGGIKSLGIGLLVAGIIGLIESLIGYLNDGSWENFGKIISYIGVALLGLSLIIGGIPLAIAGAIALIVGLVVSNWEKIKGLLQGAVDWMYSNVDWIEQKFGTTAANIWRFIADLISVTIGAFDGLFNGIKTILDGIIKVFKGVFNGDMKTVLQGFKQIFKGIFDSLWSIAKAPINLIIKGINHLIDGANKIKFNVPDWVPGMGGKKFGFNIRKIPQLARGTVVSQPTAAIIGEAGAEAVMPLENHTEWIDILADKLASKIGGNGNVNVYLDGRLIQRQVAKKEQQLAFATNS